MTLSMLKRRGLLTTAIGGGMAWLGGRALSLVARRGRHHAAFASDPFAAVCMDLSFPETIGKACLDALPAAENSRGSLARVILGDIRAAGMDDASPGALALAIRERSRNDFRDGRIVTVDGWMLSLTETRLYALAASRARPYGISRD